MDKIKTSELILSHLLDWVKTSESRLSFILSMSTAMIGVLVALFKSANCVGNITLCVSGITTLLLLFTIFFSAFAAFPRTSGPENSLIYFGGIAKKDFEDYSDEYEQMTEEDYLNDLISQCHRNAEIAEKKYVGFKGP